MALLVSFTRYEDHVAGKLALAEINERAVENQLELAKAHLLVTSFNRDAAVVSRELTRRTAGATPEKRASRFGS